MTWSVRILEAQDMNGRTVYDVVATCDEPVLGENPDHFVGCYPDRLKAMVAGRLFAQRPRERPPERTVIPFPTHGRAA
jgi:hypothetical protein